MKPWNPINPHIPDSFHAIGAETFLLAMKYIVGRRNVTPITLPQRRCVHSIQYICLNSSSVIRGFKSLNSGDERYFVNSDSHCSGLNGGSEPVTGRHSVMLRPDSVRRVRPPKTTIPKTLAALPRSQ